MFGICSRHDTTRHDGPERRLGRRGFVVGGLALAALPLARARADGPTPVALTAQDQADLKRVVAYLNGISTMTAQFSQIAANGAIAYGKLWLDRPWRMRIQYNPPSPILLIADRFYVYYIDQKLEQVQEIGLKSTPAWFLLRDQIRFGDDLTITRFDRLPNRIVFTVVEKAHSDVGQLTLVFRDKPMALLQWTVLDQQDKTTTVLLSQEQFGMALDPKLFQYHNPYADSQDSKP